MKKYVVIALLLGVVLIALCSCAGGAAGPGAAVETYVDAMKTNDMAKMKSLSTGDMVKLWDLFAEMKKLDPEATEEMDISREFADVKEIKIEEKEVTGDTGNVDVTVDGDTMTIVCTKVDGKWLISDMLVDGESFLEMIPMLEMGIKMMKMEGMPGNMMDEMPRDIPGIDRDGDGE